MYYRLYVAKFGLYKFADENGGALWAPIFKFIHRSSSNDDRLKKILIINYVLFEDMDLGTMMKEDKEFKSWLFINSQNGFKDIVCFKDPKKQINRKPFKKQITF